MKIRTWVKRNIDEIANHWVLCLYGLALSLIHIFMAYTWQFDERFEIWPVLGTQSQSICWPFFTGCEVLHGMSRHALTIGLSVYSLLAAYSALLFAKGAKNPRLIQRAWLILTILEIVRITLLVSDFRIRHNHHYMTLFVSAIFLFGTPKVDLLKLMLCLLYFAAGLLKLNEHWITGRALWPYRDIFTGTWWLTGGALTVIYLELIGIWGLFSKNKFVIGSTLFLLFVFHIYSSLVVGWFYPLLMTLLLIVFLSKDFRWRPKLFLHPAILAFCLAQIYPYFLKSPVSLRGEGRLYSLFMFHASAECNAYVDIKLTDGSSERRWINHTIEGTHLRIRCEPLLYWNYAKNKCRELTKNNPDFSDLDLYLESRLKDSVPYSKMIEVPNFCSRTPKFKTFGSNDWINPPIPTIIL